MKGTTLDVVFSSFLIRFLIIASLPSIMISLRLFNSNDPYDKSIVMVALIGRIIIHDDDDDDDKWCNSVIELHANHADLKLQLSVDFGKQSPMKPALSILFTTLTLYVFSFAWITTEKTKWNIRSS